MVDLPAAQRNQIYALLDSVQPSSKYKALIIDEAVKRIFSYSVETSDILHRQVANVQQIDAKRQAEPYLEAVYICECNQYTIGCITADFVRRPARYKAAHVFFLSGYSESLVTKFRNSVISRYLSHVGTAHFNFLALEQQTFSLGEPRGIDRLYNAHVREELAPRFTDAIGRRVADVCRALGEAPYVRYVSSGVSPVPEMIAQAAASHIAKIQTPDTPNTNSSRTTILILDRSIDLFAPFMHEFTFQALAYDVLQFGEGNLFASSDGTQHGRLSEHDTDWTSLRHRHISEVTEQLTARVRELKEANPHFSDPSSEVSVRDVRNMMASLPSFVKSKDTVGLNLQVAVECVDAIDQEHLRELAEFEQTAALGTEGVGSGRVSESGLADHLVAILARPDLTIEQKQRALSVYVLHRKDGLFMQDWGRLGRHGGLSRADIETVTNLAELGGAMVKLRGSDAVLPPQYGCENPDESLLFVRYVPGLKQILELTINGKLDTGAFPYAGDQPTMEEAAVDVAASLRNPRQRATWAQNAQSVPGNGANGGAKPRRKLLVYMVGGFTASEARTVYELSRHFPRDIVLGGDDVITPQTFLTFLRRQKATRAELNLPEDAPQREVPEHLRASDRENRPMQASPGPQSPPPAAVSAVNGGNSGDDNRPITQSLANRTQPAASTSTSASKGVKSRLKTAFRRNK